MIKKTSFENLKENSSFYIGYKDEFFIKSEDGNGYIDTKTKEYSELPKSTQVYCDEERMKVKPEIPEKPKKFIIW